MCVCDPSKGFFFALFFSGFVVFNGRHDDVAEHPSRGHTTVPFFEGLFDGHEEEKKITTHERVIEDAIK